MGAEGKAIATFTQIELASNNITEVITEADLISEKLNKPFAGSYVTCWEINYRMKWKSLVSLIDIT